MQHVSIFATATAQNSHKNFHQFYLPKNLCHGGTQKEVEQVSELHTCKEPTNRVFFPTHQRYDGMINVSSGIHSFKTHQSAGSTIGIQFMNRTSTKSSSRCLSSPPNPRCLLMVSSDRFSCNGPGKRSWSGQQNRMIFYCWPLWYQTSKGLSTMTEDPPPGMGILPVTSTLQRGFGFLKQKNQIPKSILYTQQFCNYTFRCENKSKLPFWCESHTSWSSNHFALRTWRFARFLAQW